MNTKSFELASSNTENTCHSVDMPNLKKINIGEQCFNNLEKWVVENIPGLEEITVRKDSMNKIKILKIQNNEKLNTIQLLSDKSREETGFRKVQSFTLNSILFNLQLLITSSLSTKH